MSVRTQNRKNRSKCQSGTPVRSTYSTIVVRLLQFLHLLTFYRAVSGKGGGKRIVTLHNVMHTYESRFVALLLPASSFLNYYRGS